MIERYTDHAANERTFLAWMRTAIAVMAFGFLVEKFDLFLRIEAMRRSGPGGAAGGSTADDVSSLAGLGVIAFGAALIVLSAWRFHDTGRRIDAAERSAGRQTMTYVVALLVVVIGLGLGLYFARSVLLAR